LFIGDPGAEFSFGRFRILKKKQKHVIGGEGLLKLPQLWKKAKRCAAFSHTVAWISRAKNHARLIHSSNKPGGG
jgi:hypothetical protein